MKKWKKDKMQYLHRRKGDIILIEIKDVTRRVIYRTKFNIRDKNAILAFLQILENYSGFSIIELIKEKLQIGEWW